MVTVTFDELEVNATFAALDDRLNAMSRQLARLREQRDSPNNAFAVECTQAAIRHATRAKLALLGAIEEPAVAAEGHCASCGADGSYSRHWVHCPNFPKPVLSGIEQYQAEGR